MSNLNKLSRNLRDPVVSTMTGLFSHGPAPLANTLEILGSWGLDVVMDPELLHPLTVIPHAGQELPSDALSGFARPRQTQFQRWQPSRGRVSETTELAQQNPRQD